MRGVDKYSEKLASALLQCNLIPSSTSFSHSLRRAPNRLLKMLAFWEKLPRASNEQRPRKTVGRNRPVKYKHFSCGHWRIVTRKFDSEILSRLGNVYNTCMCGSRDRSNIITYYITITWQDNENDGYVDAIIVDGLPLPMASAVRRICQTRSIASHRPSSKIPKAHAFCQSP